MDPIEKKIIDAKQSYLSQPFPGDLGELVDRGATNQLRQQRAIHSNQNRFRLAAISTMLIVAASILIVVFFSTYPDSILTTTVEETVTEDESAAEEIISNQSQPLLDRSVKQRIGFWSRQTIPIKYKPYSVFRNTSRNSGGTLRLVSLSGVRLFKKTGFSMKPLKLTQVSLRKSNIRSKKTNDSHNLISRSKLATARSSWGNRKVLTSLPRTSWTPSDDQAADHRSTQTSGLVKKKIHNKNKTSILQQSLFSSTNKNRWRSNFSLRDKVYHSMTLQLKNYRQL